MPVLTHPFAAACHSLEQVVMERYVRLGEQMAMCYSTIPLKPSPAELQQIFKEVGPPV